MLGQRGFFDVDERLAALSRAGDPLERLASVVDFEAFRDELVRALLRSDRAKGGRPPYDAVLMFRLLILRRSTRCRTSRPSTRCANGSRSCASSVWGRCQLGGR